MHIQRGFSEVVILIALALGLLVVGGGAYYVTQQQSPSPTSTDSSLDNAGVLPATNSEPTQTQTTTNTSAQTSQNTADTKPTITVTAWHSEGPATITVSYTNLPKKTSALALCRDDGACTDWVESFTPSSPTGTYTMSVQHGYAESQKSFGPGKYKIVVVGSEFTDQIAVSNIFTVWPGQSANLNPASIKITSPNGGEVIKLGSATRIRWEATNVPSDTELEVELFEITGDKILVSAVGACLNCTGGGLRSGVSVIPSIANGAGSVEWVAGEKYGGGYVNPGSHYVMKATIRKRGFTSAGECPEGSFNGMCEVVYEEDWSDRAFSLTN